MRPCAHPRCEFPVGGVGEAYGLCVKHGHEERDRRLRERDAQVRAAAPPAPLRPNLSPTLPRPLSAIVGVRPVPVTIQPSAATVAAKETPVSKPMTLAPDADAHPERCRIAKCTRPPRGRGLCNAHVQRAYREGVVDTLGLPSKTPYKAASARKTVAPTAPKPTPPTELRLSRSEQQIAEQQAAKEEVAKLRAERDAANGRAEQAERAMRDLEALVRSEFAYAPGVIDLFDWVRDIASKVREVKLRFEDWEARGVVSAVTLEHVCAELGIKRDGDADWVLAQLRDRIEGAAIANEVAERLRRERAEAVANAESARNVLDNHIARLAMLTDGICEILGIDKHPSGSTSWVLERLRERIKGDAAKLVAANEFEDLLRAEHAKTLPWVRAAKECAAALGVTTPEELVEGAKALSLDQHPPATIQRPGLPALPEPKPHRVKQAGGRDLGVLVGYLDQTGLFRVTSGASQGAAYGCLYSAEPVERPELGEPEPGATVWVRTTIDEATPNTILTRDGGRFPRAEWGPGRFVRRQSKPGTRIAWQPTPTVADDDIPF